MVVSVAPPPRRRGDWSSAGSSTSSPRTHTRKRYEAEADILVSPIEQADTTFTGFTLLRESNDRSRSIITAARLIHTPQVADAVRRRLGLSGSRSAILDSVTVTP